MSRSKSAHILAPGMFPPPSSAFGLVLSTTNDVGKVNKRPGVSGSPWCDKSVVRCISRHFAVECARCAIGQEVTDCFVLGVRSHQISWG